MTRWWYGIADWGWEAYHYFEAGGWIMIPLLAVSVWLWTLILVKLSDLSAWRSEAKTLNRPGGESVSHERLAGWPRTIYERFTTQRSGLLKADRRILDGLLVGPSSRLEKHVDAIMVLATISPLIGLLGTVTGMITTFDVIADFGTGNAKGLAGGISEALITTQGGLMAALPGMLMGNFIRRRVDRAKQDMERFSLMLLNRPSHAPGRV